jgi:diguanylate cyclase (GGDEF)-like protein
MTLAWSDADVATALEREACRLERLVDEADRAQAQVRHARALAALEQQRRSVTGMAEVIEQAALRDDVATLAQAQARIRDQRAQIARLDAQLEALRAEHHIDGLTGCANRAGFAQALGREWRRAQREAQPIGMVLVGIASGDGAVGALADDALRAIARAIRAEATRPGELVARIGTNAFAVLAPHAQLAHALALGERVRCALPGEAAAGVALAVGVTAMMPSAGSPQELERRAERALARAADAGRGRAVALTVERGADVFFIPSAPARQPAGATTVGARTR